MTTPCHQEEPRTGFGLFFRPRSSFSCPRTGFGPFFRPWRLFPVSAGNNLHPRRAGFLPRGLRIARSQPKGPGASPREESPSGVARRPCRLRNTLLPLVAKTQRWRGEVLSSGGKYTEERGEGPTSGAKVIEARGGSWDERSGCAGVNMRPGQNALGVRGQMHTWIKTNQKCSGYA